MKKLLIGLTLIASMPLYAGDVSLDDFIQTNDLKVCESESINNAEFLSFKKEVSEANAGKTTFHLSGESEYINPKYIRPNFIERMFLGEDGQQLRRVRDIEMPSNFEGVVYEIVNDNSKTRDELKVFGNPVGYGHGSSIKSKITDFDIDVYPVAGEVSELASKLTRLNEEFLGDSRNSKIEFSRKYDAVFYCRN